MKLDDLTGNKYGKLKVISLSKIEKGKIYWNCECDCGGTKEARADLLRGGQTTHCGCSRKKVFRRENIVGKKVGELTIVKERMIDGAYYYDCVCSCGRDVLKVRRQKLIEGKKTCCYFCKYNKYDLDSTDYGIGYDSSGNEFYFDKEDFELIRNYVWHVRDGGNGYVSSHREDGSTLLMHMLLHNNKTKRDIDHINTVKYDNRKSNLRDASRSENTMNKKPTSRNTSGTTGVSYNNTSGYWQSSIMKDGVHYHLGIYNDKESAINARKEMESKLYGDFSYDK